VTWLSRSIGSLNRMCGITAGTKGHVRRQRGDSQPGRADTIDGCRPGRRVRAEVPRHYRAGDGEGRFIVGSARLALVLRGIETATPPSKNCGRQGARPRRLADLLYRVGLDPSINWHVLPTLALLPGAAGL
jgi:hypothetical protein